MKSKKSRTLILILLCSLFLTACTAPVLDTVQNSPVTVHTEVTPEEIPEFSGEPYVELNGNEPEFSEDELTEHSFETYSELDSLGRCGAAFASVGTDLMPTGRRESIGHIKPTGWHTVTYDQVDGDYLYNRCHLIGYQLSGENANEENLITGTRYMNVDGMLPFENMVADYVTETENHVLYRVTPYFEGNNLLADGVQMEALSVEDDGEGVSYNVYVYNAQPGIHIDYATGDSAFSDTPLESATAEQFPIRGNSHSMIYHCPGQASYEEMENSKYLVVFQTEQDAAEAGYRKAKR